jgi:hypothetical protein
VGYTEAHHAASAGEVIESARMTQEMADAALRGNPDMTRDPVIQHREKHLNRDLPAAGRDPRSGIGHPKPIP